MRENDDAQLVVTNFGGGPERSVHATAAVHCPKVSST
jgi:hypothetical protein